MLLDILDLEGLLRNGSWSMWLMVFVLVCIFYLVGLITDYKRKLSVVEEQNKHTVTPAWLAHFVEQSNVRLLKRIQSSYRRTVAKGGAGTFDEELQKEIDVLEGSAGSEHGDPSVHESDDF